MAGLEAAHARFGRLPFAEIFEPAIYFAEEGFPISEGLSRMTESFRPFLTRLPETRAVYYREDGGIYAPGEIFRQPSLARTLRLVAGKGSAYMYSGAWARKFVEAVRRDGGKMTLEDMQDYRPQWIEPVCADFRDYRVCMAGGGLRMAGMLNMLDISGLADRGHYAESPDSFYWFCRIIKAAGFGDGLDGEGLRKEEWQSREFAEKAWKKLQDSRGAGEPGRGAPSESHHSDAVVAADASGNVAALLHSSNTRGFGESGLCVEGIAIPDSATFQQAALSYIEPGERFFNPTVPLIVTRNGKPVAAMSAIGSGIYEESVKCLFNILGFGKGPQEAIDAPGCVPTFTDAVNAPSSSIAVAEGWYPDPVLEGARKMGLAIEALPFEKARRTKGAAAIITLDPETGTIEAGSARRFSLGY
jgi:gamma-glutamyltranspeptidase/glutathione hydrolase